MTRRRTFTSSTQRATSSLKEGLAPGRNPASLEQSRFYLELSDFLCRDRDVSDPVQLLCFYYASSLMGKMTLGRLSENARMFFIAMGNGPLPLVLVGHRV